MFNLQPPRHISTLPGQIRPFTVDGAPPDPVAGALSVRGQTAPLDEGELCNDRTGRGRRTR
jgi:hypothetical protein